MSGEGGDSVDSVDPRRPVFAIGLKAARIAVGHLDVVDLGQIRGQVLRRFGALDLGRVQLRSAVHEGHGTEAVENDVVHALIPEPDIVLDTQDGGGDQSIAKNVDRSAVIGVHPLEGGRARVVLAAQIHQSERVVQGGVDDLSWLRVDLGDTDETGLQFEGCARRCAPQQFDVEITAQLDVLRDVGGYRGVHVLREPHPQLGR
ncbi:hypothetical protein HQO84_05000 [Rhodococcus fascians]|nr:hypothetical protein [Rhodococcus fascians]MBY3998905.1 hypothetical protein [Rhodococcus fascians]MBY4001133.1 hypothetical protein [Rhodococcus fascians]MBY4007551.1 hypothetical protein [Rhodococcus fascians]MBY4015444.1 hypothetical protein [Rhodococcus fascians]